ncbi:MAG: hypothetical protein JO168_06415 [Solirubrobacterales bacterium]|nr:hypothetical protein [Solirubrobacterales bacterium]MBV9714517.1 hypothetical protein [Solirubrobacterales bacterium]
MGVDVSLRANHANHQPNGNDGRAALSFNSIPSMPFETFTRQRRSGRQPFVTIQKKGVISLNKASFDALQGPEFVELLYDADARLVGLRKADSSVEHAYQVRAPVENHATWLISGSAFVSYYEIDTSTSVRRPARLDGELLIVDLNHPGVDPRAEQADSEDV